MVTTDEVDKEIEKSHIRKSLRTCGYPQWSFGVANRKAPPRQKDSQTTKSRGSVSIPYVRGTSETIRRALNKRQIAVHYKPRGTLREMLVAPKDPVKPENQSGVVYQIPCATCVSSYVGETGRSLGTRLKEHRKDTITFDAEDPNVSAVAAHQHETGHKIDWENTRILDKAEKWFERGVKEAAYIIRCSRPLNRNLGRHQLPPSYHSLIKSDLPPVSNYSLRPPSGKHTPHSF